MWTQNWAKTDQAAWLKLPVLRLGFPGWRSKKSFPPKLLAVAGRLAAWQANAAGAPSPAGIPMSISMLAVPSFAFAFPFLGCAKSGQLDPYHVPQYPPM